ncbi:hypothetical protein CLOM_g22821 [Closterium sp. NIES-68]|nr:hypothetical protein CLOM_g22821 [Closterium sp. NIES-68]GJP72808.1 hypothetical protein CLOP_g3565 [Closterium sp. NIES-67]
MATWLPEPTPNQDPPSPEPTPQARSTFHHPTTASGAPARSESHAASQVQSREQFYRHSNQPRGRPTSRPRSRSRSKSGRKGGSSNSASGAPSSSSCSSGPGVPPACLDHGDARGAGEREREAGVGGGSGGGESARARHGAGEAAARGGGGSAAAEGRERATVRDAGGGRGGGSRASYRNESARDCGRNVEVVMEWRRDEQGRESAVGFGSMRKQAASAGDVAQHAAGGVRRSSDGAMADLEGRSPSRTARLKETMSDATHLAKTRTGSTSGPLPVHKGGITRGRFQVIEGDQSDSESDVAPWPSAATPSGKAEAAPATPTAPPAGASGPLLAPSPFTAAAATAASAAHAAAAAAAAAGASGSVGAAAAGRGCKEGNSLALERRRMSTAGSASSSSSPYYSPSSHSPTAPHPSTDLRHGPLPGFAGPLRFEGGSAGGSWRGTGSSSGSASGVDAGQRSTGSGGSAFETGQRMGSSESLLKEGPKPGSGSSGSSGSAGGRGVRGAWERGSGAETGEGVYAGEGHAREEQERAVEEWEGKESGRHDRWAGARDAGGPRDGTAGRDGAGGRPKARSEPLVGEKAAAAAGVGGGRRSAHTDMVDRSQRDEGPAAAGSSGRSKAGGTMVSRSAPLTHSQAPAAAAAASGTPKRGATPTGDGQERWKERGMKEEREREERGREERGREERGREERGREERGREERGREEWGREERGREERGREERGREERGREERGRELRGREERGREERGREERGREERGGEERNQFEREADGRRAGGVEKDRKSWGREREARKSDEKGKERVEERGEQGRTGGGTGRVDGREMWGDRDGRREEKGGRESARPGRSREERGREERERGLAHGRGVGRVGVQRRGRFSVTTDDVDAQDGAPPTVMCTSSMHRPHPQAARLLPPALLFPRAPLAMHVPVVCAAPPLLPARRLSAHQATSRPPLPAPAPLLPSPVAALPSSLPALPAALVADALLLVPHLRTLLQHSCEQQEVLFNLIKELAAAHPVVSAAQHRPVLVAGMQVKLPTDKEQVLMLKIAEMQCKVAKLVDNVLTYRNRNAQLLKQVEVFKHRQTERKRLVAMGPAHAHP